MRIKNAYAKYINWQRIVVMTYLATKEREREREDEAKHRENKTWQCVMPTRLQIIILRAADRTWSTYKSVYTALALQLRQLLPDEMSYPIVLGINIRLYEAARGCYINCKEMQEIILIV